MEWLNFMLPHLRLSTEASSEELRACFVDGIVLCSILNKLCPGSVEMVGSASSVGFFKFANWKCSLVFLLLFFILFILCPVLGSQLRSGYHKSQKVSGSHG